MAQDTVIQVKSSSGWKFKVILGLGGLVVIVILASLYRFELGLIALAIGLGYAARVAIQAGHQYKLSQYEQRRIEADTRKAEAEATKARHSGYFIETNTGVFFLENSEVSINSFYPAVSASKLLADVPMLPAPETPKYRKLLDVNFVHLLITGATNTGKTTVANWLIDYQPADTICYILDPHAKFNQWSNRANEMVGTGRNYQAIDGKLSSLLGEMDRRYSSSRMQFQKILVVIDEWLSILEHCSNAKSFFEIVGSEARKVNMSLILTTISATVDDLNVSASVRDNLAQLSLNRTLKSQNLGELKWSKRDTELVELPGPYLPRYQLPAKVEPVELEPMPILDAGPAPFTPTLDELKIYELHLQGMSLRKISREVFNSVGGNQVNEIRATLAKFNVSV